MNRKKMWIILAVIGVAVVIAFSLKFLLRDEGPWEVRILTATPGGTYCPLGKGLARILEQLPRTPITDANAIESTGSIANIDTLKTRQKSRHRLYDGIGPSWLRPGNEEGAAHSGSTVQGCAAYCRTQGRED